MSSETKIKINTYSKEEVIKHNTIDDCWLIVDNKVYDVTPFIKLHPGGSELLMSRAGEDASSYFTMKHGLDKRVNKFLEKYYIGDLVEKDLVKSHIAEEPFIKELLQLINDEKLNFVSTETRRKFNLVRGFLLSVFFSLSIVALYLSTSWMASLALIIVQAFIGVSLFGLLAHESTHHSFPKNKLAKTLLQIFWPVFWPFISRKPLIYEHNSHHVKIGDEEYDFEVAGFSKFIRYSSSVKWSFWHQYQHKLAKFLYPFYANIITTFGGYKSSFWRKHNRKVAWDHGVSLVVTFSYYVLAPSIVSGFSYKWILFYLMYQSVLFTGIYLGAAINHFVPATIEEMPEDKVNLYAYYICHHTSNFGAQKNFWFWFTGGFNIQIEHHLSPFVPVENLRKLMPIVKMLCEKHAYPYHDFEGFSDLWNAHYAFLEALSKNEKIESEIKNKSIYQAR